MKRNMQEGHKQQDPKLRDLDTLVHNRIYNARYRVA